MFFHGFATVLRPSEAFRMVFAQGLLDDGLGSRARAGATGRP